MNMQRHNHNLPLILLIGLLLPSANSIAAGETTRVSIDSAGVQGNSYSADDPAISADGRYVAFSSYADNLVPGDTNGSRDVFVHDRLTGTTSRVNVDSSGMQENSSSNNATPSISADGRYVAFESGSSSLVPGTSHWWPDVFVHDRNTGTTTLVSVNSNGKPGNNQSFNNTFSISADGRYVVFSSYADNLVKEDTNEALDAFVHDRLTGKTSRVSVNSAGEQANAGISGSGIYDSYYHPSISADGRYVSFTSMSDNLVPGDTNGVADVFVHDRTTDSTTRVNVDSAGRQAISSDLVLGGGIGGVISANGRYVVFDSAASNLVPGDTNEVPDIFVRDQLTGRTSRVSVDSSGNQGNNWSYSASISADGRYVTFNSDASNLVAGDHYRGQNLFVHDQLTGKTSRVSVDSAGLEGGYSGGLASISADGRYVAFNSYAPNLAPGDTNGETDTFVRDRLLRISQSVDLELTVTSQPDSVQNGDVGRYLFTITNHGPDTAYVNLIDTVSNGKVWSLTPSQGSCSIAAVSVCRLKNLAAGASATVRTVFKAKGDPLAQQVSISASQVDTYPDNNSITVSTPVEP